MDLGKLVERRDVGRWLAEPSTHEGGALVAALVAGWFGLPPEWVATGISLVAAKAIRRSEQPRTPE